MKKIYLKILVLCLISLQSSYAAKPLVKFIDIPTALQLPAQDQAILYYTIHNNTKLNLPLSFALSTPSASVLPNLSQCANNILPALANCTIAVGYHSPSISGDEKLTLRIYYQGRGPLISSTSIKVNQNLACNLLKKNNWQSAFCQKQYQNVLLNTSNVINVSNSNVQQEQTLGAMFGIYHQNTGMDEICYISCGQRALNATAPDENTLFELASVSKLFTGSVLGTLAFTQQINPLNPIAPYLPANTWLGEAFNLTTNESTVTFQQLATFSGGICFSDAPTVNTNGTNQVLNQSKFVQNINQVDTSLSTCINQGGSQVRLEYGLPNYLPSHNFYSNSSVGLVAQALMNIDGYPNVLEGDFNGWLCKNITNVINMPMTSACLPEEAVSGTCPTFTLPNTSPCNTSAWQQGEYAEGYHVNNALYQLGNPFKYLPWAGAGGIRSNASDMLSFIKANLNIESNLNPSEVSLLQGMQIAQTANNYLPVPLGATVQANIGSQFPLRGGQGYAWVCETIQGKEICGKIGGHENFRSFIGLSKRQNYGLIILFNTGAVNTTGGLLPYAVTVPTISTIGVNLILNNGLK